MSKHTEEKITVYEVAQKHGEPICSDIDIMIKPSSDKWLDFKDKNWPQTNDIISVKAKNKIYQYLVLVTDEGFVRYDDISIILSRSGWTHWKLVYRRPMPKLDANRVLKALMSKEYDDMNVLAFRIRMGLQAIFGDEI